MGAASASPCLYAVDGDDTITSVGGSWRDFARANDAPELTEEAVVGRSLWHFIAGPETHHLYRLLMRRVRATDAPLLVPFRCDSPGARRSMRLEIAPGLDGALAFKGILLRKEGRRALRLLGGGEPRSRALLAICSYCKRVRTPEAEWLEVEDAVVRMRLLSAEQMPRLSHAVCPHCGVVLRALLRGSWDRAPGPS